MDLSGIALLASRLSDAASKDKRLGEETLVQLLSEFSCPLNPDVERFLKEQAIDFAKKHQAVTYLVLSLEDAELLGYFSPICGIILSVTSEIKPSEASNP